MTQFYLFGGTRIVRDGTAVRLGKKERQLLAVLILFSNRRVSSDLLVDYLWSDQLPANPLNSLQDLVKRLRRALNDKSHQQVITEDGNYSLRVEAEKVDVAMFKLLASAGLVIGEVESAKSYHLLARALEIAEGELPDAKPGTRVGDQIDEILSLRAAVSRALSRELGPPSLSPAAALPLKSPVAGLAVKLADLESLVLAEVILDVVRSHGRLHSFGDDMLLATLTGAGAAVSCASALAARLTPSGGLLGGGISRLRPDGGARCLDRLFSLVSLARGGQVLITRDIKEAADASGVTRLLRPYDGDLWQIPSAEASKTGRLFYDNAPIVGREDTLRQIEELLERQRVVTLRGPGGIGKTRVARELASRLSEQFLDRICFVDLAEADYHGGPLCLVARMLGFVPQPYRHLEDTLVEFLGDSDRLLILDNCEAFSEEIRSLCDTVGDACPRVAVLVTSRTSLGSSREVVFDIGELDLPDAGELMVELAFEGAAGPLPDPLDPTILKLCAQLDGVPLAIECAASMVRTMGLAGASAALASLPDGAVLPLLDAAHRVSGRKRSIELALNASYTILHDDDALLLECLSSLRGAFRTEDAEGVVARGDVKSVSEGLGRLWEASLIKRTGEDRWRLLEPVRQFGATRLLRKGDHSSQSARHARHFISLAIAAEAGLTGAEAQSWVDRLTDAYSNLDKALSWSVESGDAEGALELTGSLWWYWASKGMFVEGSRAVERALALEGAHPDSLRAKNLVVTSHLSWWAGNPHRTESSLIEALEILSSLRPSEPGCRALRAWAHTGLAAARFWGGGDYDTLNGHLEEGRRLFASIGDLSGLGLNLSAHSGVAWHYGRDVLHQEKALQSLKVFKEAEHQTMVAHMTRVAGVAAANLGDFSGGRALVEQGLRRSDGIGDLGGLPLGYAFLGLLETWAGNNRRAAEAFRASILANRRLGQLWPLLLTVAFAAERAALVGRFADAVRLDAAAECVTDRTRIRLAPDDNLRVRSCVEEAMRNLESHDVEKLRAEGATMSLPSATALALDVFQFGQ